MSGGANWVFVCALGDEWGENHTTTGVMVQCSHCGKFAVGGYRCDDCDHQDVDPADQLVGHGPGKCVAVTVSVEGLGAVEALCQVCGRSPATAHRPDRLTVRFLCAGCDAAVTGGAR